MKKNNKGFTLMEMLIVVAIIAVLVAIAIPTFSGSLTKAKEAADVANVRAAYAQAVTKSLTEVDYKFSDDCKPTGLNYQTKLAWEPDTTNNTLSVTYTGTYTTLTLATNSSKID